MDQRLQKRLIPVLLYTHRTGIITQKHGSNRSSVSLYGYNIKDTFGNVNKHRQSRNIEFFFDFNSFFNVCQGCELKELKLFYNYMIPIAGTIEKRVEKLKNDRVSTIHDKQ